MEFYNPFNYFNNLTEYKMEKLERSFYKDNKTKYKYETR